MVHKPERSNHNVAKPKQLGVTKLYSGQNNNTVASQMLLEIWPPKALFLSPSILEVGEVVPETCTLQPGERSGGNMVVSEEEKKCYEQCDSFIWVKWVLQEEKVEAVMGAMIVATLYVNVNEELSNNPCLCV